MTFEEEPKKKRKPSKWQLFLKECMPNQKNGSFPEKVGACSIVYKDLKEKNPKKLDEIIDKVQRAKIKDRLG